MQGCRVGEIKMRQGVNQLYTLSFVHLKKKGKLLPGHQRIDAFT